MRHMDVLGRYGSTPVSVPNGRMIHGRMPGLSAVTLREHELRDVLARQIGGVTEASLGYGRADVLTSAVVFEVEPAKAWRHAVRQALQYAAQSGCEPAVALFGPASKDRVLDIYLRLRDGLPPVQLWWWHEPSWLHISSRAKCRQAAA